MRPPFFCCCCCFFFCALPPEAMMSGKFPAQKKLFDHPSASLGDQFATRFYTVVGIPFTRNRGPEIGPEIHCRRSLRCKSKTSNQQSLNPWSDICRAFSDFLFIFCINACQSLPTWGAHPSIERSIRFLSTFSFRS